MFIITMTDKEIIREIPVSTDGWFGNIILGIFIAAVVGIAIWAVATGRINLWQNQQPTTKDLNVKVELPNPTTQNPAPAPAPTENK